MVVRKKLKQVPMLNDKEMLLAYVSTLGDSKCKEAYNLLKERFDTDRSKMLFYNSNGVIDRVKGQIRLTTKQYERVISLIGEQAFKDGCKILDEYINYIKEQKEVQPKYRKAYKEYTTMSHMKLFTTGWVRERLNKMYPQGLPPGKVTEEAIDFFEISSMEQAKQFIESVPTGLRFNSPEVEYLLTQYPTLRGEFKLD